MQGSMSNMFVEGSGVQATQLTANEQIRQNEASIHALNDRLRAAERLLAKERFLRDEAFKRLDSDVEFALNTAFERCQAEMKQQTEKFSEICEKEGNPLMLEMGNAKDSIKEFEKQHDDSKRDVHKRIELNESKIKFMEERAETIRKNLREQIQADCKTLVRQESDLSGEVTEMLKNAELYLDEKEQELVQANEQMVGPMLKQADAFTEQLHAERDTRMQNFLTISEMIKDCAQTINEKVCSRSRNQSHIM